MADRRITASDFPSASAAADHAHEAVATACDFALVVSLALSTEGGHLTLHSQEALWTVAQAAADKAREARNAIDIAGAMIRAEGRGR